MESVKTLLSSCENRRRAVAVMNVGIHDHRRANRPLGLQSANGNGNIVQHAETFAVAGIGVVESPAQIGGEAVAEGVTPGERRASGCEPEASHRRDRDRDFKFHALAESQRIGFQPLDPGRGVHAQHVFIGRGLRREKILLVRDSLFDQLIVDQTEFLRRENVRAKIEIVLRVIDQLERQHGSGNVRRGLR